MVNLLPGDGKRVREAKSPVDEAVLSICPETNAKAYCLPYSLTHSEPIVRRHGLVMGSIGEA